jgi:hypothetical protein
MAYYQVYDGNPDGVQIAPSATDKVGFYGETPIAQRAAAAQATSLVGTASATAVDTDLKAAIIEIMDTLTALGLWKGSA